MAKIYTKTGDDGTTGLLGPGRVPKDDRRIEAYGTVDELNAVLGVARADREIGLDLDRKLGLVQEELFAVGAALADPDPEGPFHGAVPGHFADRLEREIDALDAELPRLEHFILPGGTPIAARLHLARTVCRRAERAVVSLAQAPGQHVPEPIIVYLNRLSDYLFVLARSANARSGVADVPWRGL
ncbi:cob(I)yrinic acid a,c-diamide adenosyltransferase [Tautonia plasticadhaerens]|uniref:Corrinoid adenosyltransferase n=1 Tax=Tautonia plasticadhaerens TaxID=2527974 RepID=A0A518HCF4_9BACT|nr:cob(I)yrinic acid a,c-diamide adenosyltransferase [Tautonia plasticadhaerens]QDV38520.1 Cob(I)yrinic acid a,c-diamide adenosyltransferase [Tautonia plasticadhaerens]